MPLKNWGSDIAYRCWADGKVGYWKCQVPEGLDVLMAFADPHRKYEEALEWALEIVKKYGDQNWKPDDPDWNEWKRARCLIGLDIDIGDGP